MKFEKSTHYSVTYKDQEYIRFDNDCWYQYYGSSLEPVSDCSELDKVFIDTRSPIAKETAPVELKTLNRQYPNISTDLEKKTMNLIMTMIVMMTKIKIKTSTMRSFLLYLDHEYRTNRKN